MLSVLIGACSSTPQPIEDPDWISDCPDLACREAWVLKRHGNHELLARAIREIEQPEEQIFLVQRLIDEHPGFPQQVCQALPPGDAQQYCAHLNNRPHLSEEPRPSPSQGRRRVGPSNTELDSAASLAGFVDSLVVDSTVCADAVDERACRYVSASEKARGGELRAAASICKGTQDQKWSAECLFSVAELAVKVNGVGVYAQSIDLCMAAAPFRQHCHSHLLSALSHDTPAADAPPEFWASTLEDAEQIDAAWAGRDERMRALVVDRFWSEALHQSYRDAPPSGNPVDILPPRALPHIRAALSWRLVEQGPPRAWEEWMAAAREGLAHRTEAVTRPRRDAPEFPHSRNLWGKDKPGDEKIPATFFLTTSRRAASADPDEDLMICVLEALARSAHEFNFSASLSEEYPLVDWTSRRLGHL
jgi:hypothetical protein